MYPLIIPISNFRVSIDIINVIGAFSAIKISNISSLVAQRNLTNATQSLNQAIERMTTGYKINHASDNAAHQ